MIIGRQFVENQYEEKLYSTGNDELDEMLEKAFCEGYEYAQKEFGRTGLNAQQAKQFFKGGNGALNKAAKRSTLISNQANKLKNQGVPQFTSSGFRTIQNPEYDPSELLRGARGNVNKYKYSGSEATNSLEMYGSGKRARLSELSKSNGASLDQAINDKATGRGSIGLYKKQPGKRIYDHGF